MRILLFCFVFSIVGFSFSQKSTANQFNTWLVYSGNHKLTKKWGIHTDYQWRRNGLFVNKQQALARVGLEYYATQNTQFTIGYAWVRSFPFGEQPVLHTNDEHRAWQQFSTTQKVGRFDLQHRYRLEQRFLEKWIVNSDETYTMEEVVLRHRARYRLQVTLPISQKEMADNTLFTTVSNEIYVNLGKGVAKNLFDQNRILLAFGWRFTKDFNVQLGYLNQYIAKADGVSFERNHTWQTSLTYNIHRVKKV